MTTLQFVGLVCPICDIAFESRKVVEKLYVRQRTDFQLVAVGEPPLHYEIHQCEKCGYAGETADFERDPDDNSSFFRSIVWSEITPHFAGGCQTVAEKYEAAAKIAVFDRHYDMRQVAERYHKAAWACRDEGVTEWEDERHFLRKAAESFKDAFSTYGLIPVEERAYYCYLIGEIYRRVDNMVAAGIWLGSVRHEIIDTKSQELILDAAVRQLNDPREYF